MQTDEPKDMDPYDTYEDDGIVVNTKAEVGMGQGENTAGTEPSNEGGKEINRQGNCQSVTDVFRTSTLLT